MRAVYQILLDVFDEYPDKSTEWGIAFAGDYARIAGYTETVYDAMEYCSEEETDNEQTI